MMLLGWLSSLVGPKYEVDPLLEVEGDLLAFKDLAVMGDEVVRVEELGGQLYTVDRL